MSRFPPDARARINAECALKKKPEKWWPPRWANPLFQIVSRSWYEWHIRRGRNPNGSREAIGEYLREAVIARDGMVCGICRNAVGSRAELHIDHVFPVAHGGRTVLGNLQVSHALCNMRKGAKV